MINIRSLFGLSPVEIYCRFVFVKILRLQVRVVLKSAFQLDMC